jgi:biopolymer transport protein ExbD
MTRRGRKHRTIELDITSLIDVLFMLIIFFVMTTAFVQGSVVSLPRGTPPPLPDKEQIVLTVTKSSEILWAGERLLSGDLARRVAALTRSADILLAGDRDARYGDVAELLDHLRRYGVPSVGLAFEGNP